MKQIIKGAFIILLIPIMSSAQTSYSGGAAPVIEASAKPAVKSIKLANNVRLQYVEQGDASGLPVIFLHGYTDSWHSFETVLPHLPKNIHAFAISQRGHGNSDRPQSGYNPKDFAKDVALFMKQQKLNEAVIVGHSLGGLVAQRFALDYPQLCKGLVIVSSAAAFANNPGVPEFLDMVDQLKDPVDKAFAEGFQKSTITKPIGDEYFNTIVAETMKVPARVWKAIAIELRKIDYTPELGGITQRTLILWGDQDIFCLKNNQDDLRNNIKNSNLITYQGIGHALHWEDPQRFVSDLLNFMQSL